VFQVSLIEQNLAAQENILKALTEAYARYAGTRKATTEILRKREATINALIASYDAYEDLIATSSKGLEFYRKLETNVNKLLQRVKSTCKVQDEERDQILAKNNKTLPNAETLDTATESFVPSSGGPKLKDYLQNMKRGTSGVGGYVSGLPSVTAGQTSSPYYNAYSSVPAPVASPQPSNYYDHSGLSSQLPSESASNQQWIPAIRPAPVGSEGTSEQTSAVKLEPHERKAPLPQQGYSYPTPVVSMDQSALIKPVTGYSSTTTYPDYNAIHYNYANTPVAYPAAQSPYIHQQQEQLKFTQGHTNMQGYSYGSTSYVPQYDPTSQGPVSSYATGNVVAGFSSGSYSVDAKPVGVSQQTSLYTTEMSHHYEAMQPTYQQGGSTYPSGTNTEYTNLDQRPQDTGAYYMTSLSDQGCTGGTYTSVQQGGRSTSTQQTPVTLAASSTPSQAYSGIPQPLQPSASITQSGYTYGTSSTFPYDNSSQNLQTGFHGQANAQTHPVVWHQQPQTSAYGVGNTSDNTAITTSSISNSAPYYGSEFHMNTSATSLSSGASSEVSLSNQQYYGSIQQQYQQFQHPYPYPTVSSGYSSQHTTEVPPNISTDSSSQFQYMAATGASCYTNAGSYITSQTCSSQTSVDGNTFAAQYSVNEGVSNCETPVHSQASYYSLPYGYQYGGVDAAADTLPQNPHHVQESSYTDNAVMNQTPQSPMTYMQARGQNNSTTTTYSQQEGSSVSSSSVQAVKCNESENTSSSNIDLLAGLDFSLNQAPLVPQQPVTVTDQEKVEPHTKSVNSDIKQITSALSNINIPTTTAVIKTDLPSEVPTSECDRTVTTLPHANGLQVEKCSDEQILVSRLALPKADISQEGKLTPKTFGKDPYTDPDALNQFVQEVGKYEKFVDGLTTKTLNGPTPLDMKWKELLELQVSFYALFARSKSLILKSCLFDMDSREFWHSWSLH
jgi:tyrosine-protein phosphatase non-receptor type 23